MELIEMLGELHTVSKAAGLEMNAKKTMVMANRKAVPVAVEGKTLDSVPEYVYLEPELRDKKSRK
jgi:hypothetical protein